LVAGAGDTSGAQGISLRQIRQVVGMSQTQLADTLGFNQGAASHQEKREDVVISMLAAYVEAMVTST
jgi:predicted transcriptional regulator